MPLRLLALLALLLTISGCRPAPPVDHTAAPSVSPGPAQPWYEPEIRAFEAADRAAPPAPGQVLFIGSSSIRLWSTLAEDLHPAPVINRGFGGSKTADVLAVFDRIVPVTRPAVIVYYCGDNDLGTDNTDSAAAAEGFIEFDRRARARWPGINVFYIAIKASRARWSNWPAMARANALVRDYCERTPGAEYLDTVTPTLRPDGPPDADCFADDGLHLSPKGYAVWTSVIRGPVTRAWEERRASVHPR